MELRRLLAFLCPNRAAEPVSQLQSVILTPSTSPFGGIFQGSGSKMAEYFGLFKTLCVHDGRLAAWSYFVGICFWISGMATKRYSSKACY
jgi:hypothetical protein